VQGSNDHPVRDRVSSVARPPRAGERRRRDASPRQRQSRLAEPNSPETLRTTPNGCGVLGYEVVCKEGQLLSEWVDEWLVSQPIMTRAAITALDAFHLGNAIPERYDVCRLGSRRSVRSSAVLATIESVS